MDALASSSSAETTAALLSGSACLCPRNDESADKRRSTRLRRGGHWLKTTLVQAAWSAVRVKGGYLQAQFHRIRARRGAKKAIIAVAATMLTAIWHMLRADAAWQDLGAAHFERADAQKPPTASSADSSTSASTSRSSQLEERCFILASSESLCWGAADQPQRQNID